MRTPVGENATVPAASDDRRVLVFAGVIVLIAGLAVAGLLFLATGGTQDTPSDQKPLFLGLHQPLVKKIKEGGPLYFASPFGDNGFWLDLEHGKDLIALSIVVPGTNNCQVKFKAGRNAYVDCNDRDLHASDLDRYKVIIGPLAKDAPKDAVYVDLRSTQPAPVQPGG
jgi:hypothetical protein